MHIYKYDINVGHLATTTIDLPIDARVLSFQRQGVIPRIWVEISGRETSTWPVTFICYGTGFEVVQNPDNKYIGTLLDDVFVWHLYEVA